ncbi:MAG: FGGY family carbohydrate kinase [Verrucomicrobia bacterium]|nr:FGGY family carbohydrate kinase [Verrucomicrobiota bacterium]
MKALLGVDIGTQGTKAGLFGDDGTCLAAAFRPSALHRPGPGVVEEDPERQLDTVCAAVRECVTKARVGAGGVAGMAIAGQMAGVLGVGPDGRAVTPYDSWLDTRCTPYVTRMNQVAADEIVARTGGPASFNHGPKILWWMHERRRVFRGIRAFVQPAGYAAMRLCGLTAAQAFIDTSYLHFSGLADNRRRRWDPALCERFDVDARRLPRIVEPAEVVGDWPARWPGDAACGPECRWWRVAVTPRRRSWRVAPRGRESVWMWRERRRFLRPPPRSFDPTGGIGCSGLAGPRRQACGILTPTSTGAG